MGKLYVIKVVNGGTATVVSEWADNAQGALVSFHDVCKTLWNSKDVIKATVKILDEQLDNYQGYAEIITHAQPETESAEEG